MIVVAGATGNAGSATVAALVAAGVETRAVSRSAREWPAGVEGVAADLNDPATMLPALAGAEAVFLLSGYDGMGELLAGAADAGVRRVVLLSSGSVPGGKMDNAVTRYHTLAEQSVKASGLGWTMLQPDTFMSNTFQWLPELEAGDVVRGAFAGVPVAAIDPADLGAVSAAALRDPAHEGSSYRLSGPEALTPGDRLAILGDVLGRDLRYEAQSDAVARAEMGKAMPQEYVDAFFAFFGDGDLDESEVLPTVREILGRDPGTYRAWAEANADAFR